MLQYGWLCLKCRSYMTLICVNNKQLCTKLCCIVQQAVLLLWCIILLTLWKLFQLNQSYSTHSQSTELWLSESSKTNYCYWSRTLVFYRQTTHFRLCEFYPLFIKTKVIIGSFLVVLLVVIYSIVIIITWFTCLHSITHKKAIENVKKEL